MTDKAWQDIPTWRLMLDGDKTQHIQFPCPLCGKWADMRLPQEQNDFEEWETCRQCGAEFRVWIKAEGKGQELGAEAGEQS